MIAIPNFSTDAEMAELRALAAGKVVLELGSFKGASTIEMVHGGAKRVHSVDWHLGDHHLGDQDSLGAMWHNLRAAGVRDRVVLHVGTFLDVLPVLRPHSFDLVFIDGSHEQAAVARDLRLSQPLLHPNGVIACHDYGRWGVHEAVREFCHGLNVKDIELTDSLAVIRGALI